MCVICYISHACSVNYPANVVFSVLSGIEFIIRDVSANIGLPRRLQIDNHCNFRIPQMLQNHAGLYSDITHS